MTPARRREVHGRIKPMHPTIWQQWGEAIRSGRKLGRPGLTQGFSILAAVAVLSGLYVIAFTGA